MPTITFDTVKALWTLDLRPRGPRHAIIVLGNEVVADLVRRYNETHKEGIGYANPKAKP